MNEIDVLDKLFRLLDDLNMSAIDYSIDGNTIRMKIWSVRECRIIGRRMRAKGWQEITIRRGLFCWHMTADYPERLLSYIK